MISCKGEMTFCKIHQGNYRDHLEVSPLSGFGSLGNYAVDKRLYLADPIRGSLRP